MLRRMLTLSAVVAALFVGTSQASAEIKVGVLAPRGEDAAYRLWADLGLYLTDRMGEPVTIVPLAPTRSLYFLGNRHLDFLMSNPVQSAIAEEVYGATALATLNKRSGDQFAGVIVTRADSGIVAAAQMRGRSVVSMRVGVAAGGYIFQAYYLEQRGVRVPQDLASLEEGSKQDDLVIMVRDGLADAAFVRTGILESMARDGRISMDDFNVVDRRDDGFPLVRTTPLYPEWSVMAGANVERAVANRMRNALMALTPEHPAAQSARINGFVPPISLHGMKLALAALRIPPFDSLELGPDSTADGNDTVFDEDTRTASTF